MAHFHHVDYSSMIMGDYLKKHWGWFLALGILLTIGGFASLGFVMTTTVLSVLILGGILFSVGIIQIIEGIQTRKWGGFFLHLFVGIFYLIIGAVMFLYPGLAAASLTAMLSFFYFSIGLFRMITSLLMQFRRWGWTFFSGIVSFAVGIMIWSSWPVSGLYMIGFFIGMDLLFYGLSILFFALSARRIRKHGTDSEILM